jgi:hypothetical protein
MNSAFPLPRSGNAQLDQIVLTEALDQEVERRVAERLDQHAEAQAFLWRFRLIAIETLMMGALVAAAGWALHQPTFEVIRSAVLVAGACFASGMMLVGLSAGTGKIVKRVRRWWMS